MMSVDVFDLLIADLKTETVIKWNGADLDGCPDCWRRCY